MSTYYPSNWPTVHMHKSRGERCGCGREGTLFSSPALPNRVCWHCLLATLDASPIEPVTDEDMESDFMRAWTKEHAIINRNKREDNSPARIGPEC